MLLVSLIAALAPLGCLGLIGSAGSVDSFAAGNNLTALPLTIAQAKQLCSSGPPPFPLVETTIADVHKAFRKGELNCSQLVSSYVQRVHDHDKRGGINAVRVLNPNLTALAAEMDTFLAKGKADGELNLPPLFCVPVLVKDNLDTVGMAATNGASALQDNFPTSDAILVARLREAGAIVLGKSNMGEWAFSPDVSVGSAFGLVRNPYNLDRVTAGSSGGSAAGVAANLALVAIGTDTGNSIRGPAGHNGVVGLRPSLGLTSRTGMIPLDVTSDVGGPMTRTVADAARLLEVIQGPDPRDALTLHNATSITNYTQFLQPAGLKGLRVGVLRSIIPTQTADPEYLALFETALGELTRAGAVLVDNFTVKGNSLGDMDWGGQLLWYTGFGSSGKWEDISCKSRFRHDINKYLASSGSSYKRIEDVVSDEAYHPLANISMQWRVAFAPQPDEYPSDSQKEQGYVCGCSDIYSNPCRAEFRRRFIESMDSALVDVIAHPAWVNPPRLVGDYASPGGNLLPLLAPPTGAPAIVVPMGFSQAGLPASLHFVARPFDEAALFKATYAYEQATRHRRPPPLFGECTGLVGKSSSSSGSSSGSSSNSSSSNSSSSGSATLPGTVTAASTLSLSG